MTQVDSSYPPLAWDQNGAPRSARYDDIYFSSEDGLAESRAVFLSGCGLPGAWSGRTHFCIGELGFGTGLNIVALLDLWRRTRPPDGRLTVFSVEAHPMSARDAARALARWPELADIAQSLFMRWPGQARGFHRIDLPGLDATLDVAIMEASAGVDAWSGVADAWFLDGFAPARNPRMWRPELMRLIAERSAPGARAASFTVAGQVRRDLQAAGFAVERVPGFGHKRQRLEARLPDRPSTSATPPRVAIIGAGIAGAALARAFTALGAKAAVLEAEARGAGASGGPAALVAPRLDAGLGDHAALFAQAFRRAGQLYSATPGAVLARGAVQRHVGEKDVARFAAIAGSDLFEPGTLGVSDEGLEIEDAVVVEPHTVLEGWLEGTRAAPIASLSPMGGVWRLFATDGLVIADAEIVCLAAGMDCARLAAGLPLYPVRGQASVAAGLSWPKATLFGGYVIPTRTGVLIGATHDRDETDTAPRRQDHARNLAALETVFPELAQALRSRTLRAWTGIRATTRDYLPLAGAVPGGEPGLFVLGGLGSRGFTLAPLLAEHIAAAALSIPSPLPRNLSDLVEPARFERRARRRGR